MRVVTMDKLRLIRYFAFFIVFCAEYLCFSNATWTDTIQGIIDEASNVEPCEKMKVNIRSIFFEKDGEIVKSYAHESLTFIVNEHTLQRERLISDENTSGTCVYHHFQIKLTNSDSTSETILTFWSIQIKSFVYFASIGSKIKVNLLPTVNRGVITLDFLNPGDAELFWQYALKYRRRKRAHVIDLLKFEIFNRQTKRRVAEASFAVIHKEWSQRATTTYTISLGSDEVTQKPLLIFSSARFSVTRIIEDRVGLLLSDEPNMVFVLQFSPFENDAAVAFQQDMHNRRNPALDPMSNHELRTFIN